MRPILSLLLIFSTSFFLLGQSDNKTASGDVEYSNSIGLSVNSLGYLHGEYNYHFTKNLKMLGSIGVNYESAFVMRVGGTYAFLNWNFMSVESGLALSYWNNKAVNYPEPMSYYRKPNLLRIELPTLFNFPLSEKFTVQTGLTFLYGNTRRSYNNDLYISIKLGTLYKF